MGIILKEMKQGYTDLLLHKTNKEIICAMPIDFLSSVTRGIKDIDSITIIVNKIIDNNKEYPFYDWNSNKGYPTKKHRAAIREHGTTPYHRMTFNLLGTDPQLEIPF